MRSVVSVVLGAFARPLDGGRSRPVRLYSPVVMAATEQPPPAIPDISAEWYRQTVEFAQSTPGWAHTAVEAFTDGGVIVLFVFMLLAALRARYRPARNMALALLTPAAAAIAYGFSELSKSLIEEGRPCRVLAGVDPVGTCPPIGDWSFPSNHTTAAVAIAVGLALTWRKLGVVSLVIAAAVAYSRVFLGAHYPHDVLAGAVLGTVVALVVMLPLARPGAAVLERLRKVRLIGPLLGAERQRARPGDDAPTEVIPSPLAAPPRTHRRDKRG